MSMLDFVLDPDTRPMVANFQTRSLVMNLDPVALAASLKKEDLNRLVLERVLESAMPSTITNDELLALAERQLKKLAFIGITERFDESISVLCETFGWKIPNSVKLNVAPDGAHEKLLDDVTSEAILEATELDQALYKRACSLFDRRLRQIRNTNEERASS